MKEDKILKDNELEQIAGGVGNPVRQCSIVCSRCGFVHSTFMADSTLAAQKLRTAGACMQCEGSYKLVQKNC